MQRHFCDVRSPEGLEVDSLLDEAVPNVFVQGSSRVELADAEQRNGRIPRENSTVTAVGIRYLLGRTEIEGQGGSRGRVPTPG